jgi:hypothetical protein
MTRAFISMLAIATAAACAHEQAAPAPSTAAVVPAGRPSRPCPIPQTLSAEARAALLEHGVSPAELACNSFVEWRPELNGYGERAAREIAAKWGVEADEQKLKAARRVLLGYLVRSSFEHHLPNNLGVMRLGALTWDEAGTARPLLLYRSSTHTDADQPGSCFQSLLTRGKVRHVVNLYAGTFPFDELLEEERQAAQAAGATYHDEAREARPWRALIEEEEDYQANRALAMERAAAILNTQVLRPQGAAPRGNVLLHCGGGMHRTGMLYGILQRCINQTPMAEIEREYKAHVAYTSEQQPGGYEPLNLRFIEEFDCALLAKSSQG